MKVPFFSKDKENNVLSKIWLKNLEVRLASLKNEKCNRTGAKYILRDFVLLCYTNNLLLSVGKSSTGKQKH